MRITNNMLVNNMVYNLNQNLRALEHLQYQKTTGKKFRVPSDNPIGVSRSLKFHTDISKIEQYHRNAEDALSWMTDTEAALNEMGTVIKRAMDLSVDAANGTKTSEDLKKIQEEIDQLKDHLIQIGNTTYSGRHIFSGYKTDKKLFKKNDAGEYDGTYNIKLEAGEIVEYNIGVSETVKVNTLGGKVFGDPNGGYDGGVKEDDKAHLIRVFEDLSAALENNEPEGIQAAITNLQDSHEQVLSVRSEVGAKMNRLDLSKKKLETQYLGVTELLSKNEDVDMAEISMEIAEAQNVYVSSLMVGAKVIQPTLVEFLR